MNKFVNLFLEATICVFGVCVFKTFFLSKVFIGVDCKFIQKYLFDLI